MERFITDSPERTRDLGRQFALEIPENSIVCFFGDLGAGKTTFIQGMATAFSSHNQVTSPTFTYLHIYDGEKRIYHFDLYRLHSSDEFLSMGFDEYLFSHGICCIEWSERIASLLPSEIIKVECSHLSETQRQIIISFSHDVSL